MSGDISTPLSDFANIPDYIPIHADGHHIHLQRLHDIFKLATDLPRFPEDLGMEEMLHAPVITVAVGNTIPMVSG
jgi:hypothetical protein